MKTEERLNQAYKKAKIIEFNDDSKIIFFSDVHRGDNSNSDEFAHNQSTYFHAMSYYFNNGYTYVEVGDGDEMWEHSKFAHIRTAHSDVYYLLSKIYQAGKLIMLYGNHNNFLSDPKFVKKNFYYFYDDYLEKGSDLFPGIEVHESIILKHSRTNHEIFVVHGHQGDIMNDQLWWFSMMTVRYFWRFMHVIGFRNPASPAKNVLKQHKIEKNFSRWIAKYGKILLCGHTHRPKFPAKGDIPYFNSGCCVHPRGISGIEILDGKIMLVDWRVRPNLDGVLYIDRKVIKGPISLDNFEEVEINKDVPEKHVSRISRNGSFE